MPPLRRPPARRGAILLVVLALLALFAVIGLSFVLYAGSEATAGRIYREAVTSKPPALDPLKPLSNDPNSFLSQLLAGTTDPTSGLYGGDLVGMLYGLDGDVPYNGLGLTHEQLTIPNGSNPAIVIDRAQVLNHSAQRLDPANPATWAVVDADHTNGNGSVRTGTTVTGNAAAARANMIYIPRNAPYTYPDLNNHMVGLADPASGRVVVPSFHRPRVFFRPTSAGGTNPDPNDWFGSPDPSAGPRYNANWTNAAGRFLLVRPRPADHVSGGTTEFPYPPANPDGTITGDVENLKFTGGVQRNDSVWVDAKLSPQEHPQGGTNPNTISQKRLVVPLVAPLLLPLDGRLNLNAVANAFNGQTASRSAAGFGPFEVNPAWLSPLAVLNAAQANQTVQQYLAARSGQQFSPGALATPATPGGVAKLYFQADPRDPSNVARQVPVSVGSQMPYDAQATGPVTYPTGQTSVPTYPGYNTDYTDSATGVARLHPSLWNTFSRSPFAVTDGNYNPPPSVTPASTPVPRTFPVADLLLFGGRFSGPVSDPSGRTKSYTANTYLANPNRNAASPNPGGTAWPGLPGFQQEFLASGVSGMTLVGPGAGPGAPGNTTRSLVTPVSTSFNRPGLAPNFLTGAERLVLPAGASTPVLVNAANAVVQPTLVVPSQPPVAGTNPGISPTKLPVYNGSTVPEDFSDAARLAERVFSDNQPQPLPGTTTPSVATNVFNRDARNLRAALSGVDLNRPLADYRLSNPLNLTTTGPVAPLSNANAANSIPATEDRQALARDIFLRLAVATGARIGYDPNATGYYGHYVLPQPTGGPSATDVDPVVGPFVGDAAGYTLTITGAAPLAVTAVEYRALRWLAQLAANIVDYIDPDDVSTAFVWNPSPASTFAQAASPGFGRVADPATPGQVNAGYAQNLSTVTAIGGDSYTGTSPAGERAVFGTERPRLVLNEVYAEIANTESDANGPAPVNPQPHQVRFFLELLNPNPAEPAPAPGAAVNPLAQPLVTTLGGAVVSNIYGAVPLHYGAPTASCYRVVVSNNGTQARTDLARATNVLGEVVTPTDVKLVATLEDVGIADNTNNSNVVVEPYNPAAGNGTDNSPASRNGFAVVGPGRSAASAGTAPAAGDPAFNPFAADPTAGGKPFRTMLTKPLTATASTSQNPGSAPNSLAYGAAPVSGGAPAALSSPQLDAWLRQYGGTTGTPRKHAVLLQRLANPYLSYNPAAAAEPGYNPNLPPNPYLTVDHAARVEVQDGVRYVQGGTPNGQRAAPLSNAPPAKNTRWSTGRVQPYTGNEGLPLPASVTTAFELSQATTVGQSLTLAQTGPASAATGGALTSFFQHNNPTSTPFAWLTHLDRKLVNPLELLHVGAARPHDLTHQFGRPRATGAPLLHRHDLQHPRVDTDNLAGPLYADDGGTPARTISPLYHGLELLGVKPWGFNQPFGGRVAGKVNVNMLWDESPPAAGGTGTGRSRVFDAILDKQATSTANAFTDADLTTIWQALKASRSPTWAAAGPNAVPVVGDTGDEAGAHTAGVTDRPIKSLGAALLTANPGGLGQPFVTLPAGGGLGDTLLRTRDYPALGTIPAGDNRPLFAPTAAGQHPYQDWEPLRKAFNSLTTTTDTYLLVATVGFFEVREETTDTNGTVHRVLGKEYYKDTPGDSRSQYVAVLDRSGLTQQVRLDRANLQYPHLPPSGSNPALLSGTNPTTDYVSLPALTPPTKTSYTDAELRNEQVSALPWQLETVAQTEVPLSTDPRYASLPPGSVQAYLDGQIMHVRLPLVRFTGTPGANDPSQEAGRTPMPFLDAAAVGSGPDFRQTVSVDLGIYGGGQVKLNGSRPEYNDRPITVEATMLTKQVTTVGALGRNTGTRFFIGTGTRRELVEAIHDPDDVRTRWSVDQTAKVVKIAVRRPLVAGGAATTLQPGVNQHGAGTAVSNASFGHPGAGNLKLDYLRTDAVVRYVGELK